MPGRISMAPAGGTYYVSTSVWPGHQALVPVIERERFLTLLERVRTTFQARIYAYAVHQAGVHLLLTLRDQREEPESRLRERWRRLTPRSVPPSARLRERLSSLSGFMQTMLQRFSRDWNQRHQRSGRLWAPRYRATAVVDDRSLLASLTWIERTSDAAGVTSRGRHDQGRAVLLLASPPLRTGPGDFLCPADEAPPGCYPPPDGAYESCLERFSATITPTSSQAHGRALGAGWALGRPESLGGVISHLARASGRGRVRQVRDLDDDLGLCGVWG